MIPLGALLDHWASTHGAARVRIDLSDCVPDSYQRLVARDSLAHLVVGPGLDPPAGQATRHGIAVHWVASEPLSGRLLNYGPLPWPLRLTAGQTIALATDLKIT